MLLCFISSLSDAGAVLVLAPSSSSLFSTCLLFLAPLPPSSTGFSSGLEVIVFSEISLEVTVCLETLVKASRPRGLPVEEDAFFAVAADTFRRFGAGIFEEQVVQEQLLLLLRGIDEAGQSC